ncbi:MAG: beta-galactosidase [Rhizobiales bacterium]|nr:beta-galactosidase [Rhizobacter sp.]
MIGAVRLWDSGTRWADIEPAAGRFDFGRLDLHVALAEAQGVPVLLVLGSPPRWASARPNEDGPYGPGSAAEPRELVDWDRYVAAVARRYRGRIAQYEVWNEPYFSDLPNDRGHPSAFFTGSVATMVELARRTRAALAVADPGAGLLTPGFVGAANRLDLFLARGGARLVDGVSYHFYAESDPELIRLAADVRAVMARHGIARLPLYNTESGFALRGAEGQPAVSGLATIDRRDAAARLARSMVLGAFLGFERFYQYAWDNGRMGMVKDDGRTETESLRAYAAVRRWLRGTTLLGCRMQPARVVLCEGERGGRRLFIAWRTDGSAAVLLPVPARIDASDAEHALDGPFDAGRDATSTRSIRVDQVPVAWWSPRRVGATP